MKRIRTAAAALLAAIGLAGCVSAKTEETKNYRHISMEKAAQMMEEEDGHIIVDVRRPEEYEEGHIPGAVNIPNELIQEEEPSQLKDRDQILLVYCRTGRRSRLAAEKLAGYGYVNVYEFGGILDWPGEIETKKEGMMDLYLAGGCFWGVQKSWISLTASLKQKPDMPTVRTRHRPMKRCAGEADMRKRLRSPMIRK